MKYRIYVTGLCRIRFHRHGKRSRSLHIWKTFIEQVKGYAMAGSNLTCDFWANNIIWQLRVFKYNILVMMRWTKNKLKKQKYKSFIDWFISVPVGITSSWHQLELKMYEHHFYRNACEELNRFIKEA